MLQLVRLIPLTWRIGAIAIAIAAVGGGILAWRSGLIAEGEQRERARIETENREASDAAQAADRDVDACYAAGRMWDRKAGKCGGP